VTVTATVVVAVRVPEVPVIVSVNVPAAAVLAADTVSTLLDVAGLVPNEAVTPVGIPDAANVTPPVNPPASVTVMVSVALAPAATLKDAAERVNVNEGFPVLPPPFPTVRATVTE